VGTTEGKEAATVFGRRDRRDDDDKVVESIGSI
jgi:hypothetical protein